MLTLMALIFILRRLGLVTALSCVAVACNADFSGDAAFTQDRSDDQTKRDDDVDTNGKDGDNLDGGSDAGGDGGLDGSGDAADDGGLGGDADANGDGLGGDDDATDGGKDSDTDLTDEELERCKLEEDFVEMTFPDNIQKCIDDGKLFDFATDKCFDDVVKATSYECNWAAVKSAVIALAIPGDNGETLKDHYDEAKIVGCGERRDGKTIVVQVWIPPKRELNKKDCSYKESMSIGAECHANTSGPAGSGFGSAQGVSDCVNAE